MGIRFIPVVGAISNLAGIAWDTYQKTKQVRQDLQGNHQARTALAQRVEELEGASLEHARLLGELSKDVEQFARETQTELERRDRRSRTFIRLAWLAFIVSLASLGIALFVLLR
ncbi:MAG TPA: hypothetical protein VHH88_01930 [Verrucomicrobiae bacterium]|nr:hypothetical protein [Verrucomicrobiae bacterium]